jgi:hypothetical protein
MARTLNDVGALVVGIDIRSYLGRRALERLLRVDGG